MGTIEMQYKLTKGTGETYMIRHHEQSFALFFINEHGDLFIESDWGYWTFSWRAFSGTFKDFIVSINDDYFFSKLLINHNQWGKARNKVASRTENAIKILFKCFQDAIKQELAHLYHNTKIKLLKDGKRTDESKV